MEEAKLDDDKDDEEHKEDDDKEDEEERRYIRELSALEGPPSAQSESFLATVSLLIRLLLFYLSVL